MENTHPIRLGIIGLGAMGTEMLAVADHHPEFEVVAAADPDLAAVRRVRATHPHIRLGADPEALPGDGGLDALYIASPPDTHARYAIPAMTAGKAVLAEKPLAVRLADGEEMVRVAADTGAVNALNFVLSDRAAALAVGRALRAGELGEVVGADLRFSFPVWPRPVQQEARWVAGRHQGGFLREVASHYLFLTDRLLGPLTPVFTDVRYGAAGETSAVGALRAGEVPVTLAGRIAAAPETYEWTVHGTRRSYRITDWSRLEAGDGDGWRPVDLPGPRGSEHTRLGEFARAVRGEETTLADFAAGLRVQRLVEHVHRAAS